MTQMPSFRASAAEWDLWLSEQPQKGPSIPIEENSALFNLLVYGEPLPSKKELIRRGRAFVARGCPWKDEPPVAKDER